MGTVIKRPNVAAASRVVLEMNGTRPTYPIATRYDGKTIVEWMARTLPANADALARYWLDGNLDAAQDIITGIEAGLVEAKAVIKNLQKETH